MNSGGIRQLQRGGDGNGIGRFRSVCKLCMTKQCSRTVICRLWHSSEKHYAGVGCCTSNNSFAAGGTSISSRTGAPLLADAVQGKLTCSAEGSDSDGNIGQ
jgi:hypothetical protein